MMIFFCFSFTVFTPEGRRRLKFSVSDGIVDCTPSFYMQIVLCFVFFSLLLSSCTSLPFAFELLGLFAVIVDFFNSLPSFGFSIFQAGLFHTISTSISQPIGVRAVFVELIFWFNLSALRTLFHSILQKENALAGPIYVTKQAAKAVSKKYKAAILFGDNSILSFSGGLSSV